MARENGGTILIIGVGLAVAAWLAFGQKLTAKSNIITDVPAVPNDSGGAANTVPSAGVGDMSIGSALIDLGISDGNVGEQLQGALNAIVEHLPKPKLET